MLHLKPSRLILFLLIFVLLAALLTFGLKRPFQDEWVAPKVGPVDESIYGLGTVKSNRVYDHKLGFQSSMLKLYVREGERVEKGQLLMDFQGNPSLKSPISGTVTLLPFHEFENISPQVTAIRIEDLGDRYIEVALEQQGAMRVKSPQKVRLSFENLRGSVFHGQVQSIYPSQGEFLVRIRPSDLVPEILPGMTADVAIEVDHKEQATLVPLRAVNSGKITIKDGHGRKRMDVQVGSTDGEWVEIVSPALNDSQLVLTPKK